MTVCSMRARELFAYLMPIQLGTATFTMCAKAFCFLRRNKIEMTIEQGLFGMITPILLCGGSGTRLWPLSRKSFPKQFADLVGDESLFQASARRFTGEDFGDPLLVTGNDFRFIVTEQLGEVGITPAGIIIEPEGRNTAPAAVAAALFAQGRDPDAMVLLVPSDHAVADPEAFCAAVMRARAAAEEGRIVTFGIAPSRAETGYGWLEAGKETHPGVHELTRFIEKPDAARAEALFADRANLWNAGVFLARADTLTAAFREHAPALLAAVEKALEAGTADLGFIRIDKDLWAKVPEDPSTTRSWKRRLMSASCASRGTGPTWAVGNRSGRNSP